MASTLQVVPFGRTSRVTRRPQHTFSIKCSPWQICPVMIAPVLPGETMKNMLFQARVITDPIKDSLVGWWCEFYFFYCKHRDLDISQTLVDMMINPSVKAPLTTGSVVYYQYDQSVNYVYYCLKRVVETYFRDTGEVWNAATMEVGPSGAMINNYPAAQISQQSVLDSAILESAYTSGAPGLVVGADDTITGQEIDQTWLLWQQYRAANITHLSYEEYLATYGIPLPMGSDSEKRPELIRYVKDWSYPSNTVNPADGTPSSAVSWAIAERADKDRFFREPGFIFGVVCVRPKCYLTGQAGSVTGAMSDALSWLPAVMGDNAEYTVRKFPAAGGPMATVSADYRLDIKDLFLYGEQYTNRSTSTPNGVALPSAALGKKYPSAADAAALFKTAPAADSGVRMDGVVSLNVLGMQVDTTPTRAPGTF